MTLKPNEVHVSQWDYRRAHGKTPRGRGQWAFCPAQLYNRENYLDYVQWFSGTFGEARRAAQQNFAAQGVGEIVVCS